MPSPTIVKMPTNTTSVLPNSELSVMRKPSPDEAAMSSAPTRARQLYPKPMRRPARIPGMAAGSVSILKRSADVNLRSSATSASFGSMPFTAVSALR